MFAMNKGKTIFSQIMSLIPERDFKACVDRYKGNYRARNFSCRDQFLVMSYAQLTGRDSLRDIENYLMALSMEYETITISDLYRKRWNVELFFKWIKQHLHIKSFYGTSANAIYLQIWIAICTYLLLAYAKKVMHIEQSLHTISKNVGLFLTDKTHLNELFNKAVPKEEPEDYSILVFLSPMISKRDSSEKI